MASTEELWSKTNASITLPASSCRALSLSHFFIESIPDGKLYFVGFPVLFSNPRTFLAAAMILDLKTISRKSLPARYADVKSLEKFFRLIRLR